MPRRCWRGTRATPSMAGSRKASVFPVPVLALARMSCPVVGLYWVGLCCVGMCGVKGKERIKSSHGNRREIYIEYGAATATDEKQKTKKRGRVPSEIRVECGRRVPCFGTAVDVKTKQNKTALATGTA